MPAVAVAAAVYSGSALVAGGLTVMGTIAAVGAVAAGIGVVTGNETLTKLGSVMGIVGGVGALATGQGLLKGTDFAAESAAADAAAGASMTEAASAASPAVAGAEASGILNGAKAAPVVDQSMVQGIDVEAAGAGAPVAAADAGQQGLLARAAVESTGVGGVSTTAAASAAPTKSIWDVVGPFADKTKKFVEDNKMFSYGLLQVGGSFMQGLFDPSAEAKKKALESQTTVNDAQAAALTARTANINAPMPTAGTSGTRAPTYRTGAQPVYVAPGLLSTKVTGVPA